MLSSARPRPSMLMATPSRISTPVKAALVNCEPWSLLNTSGLPCVRSASSRQSTQNEASMLLLMRQDSTRREYQSITATRYAKPRTSRI
ncbi:hypothetical protein WJ64_11510 [Burkholderia ubonensis]|nr:hypothetical protein WJ64_11510 [Burkholderia ubonensis]